MTLAVGATMLNTRGKNGSTLMRWIPYWKINYKKLGGILSGSCWILQPNQWINCELLPLVFFLYKFIDNCVYLCVFVPRLMFINEKLTHLSSNCVLCIDASLFCIVVTVLYGIDVYITLLFCVFLFVTVLFCIVVFITMLFCIVMCITLLFVLFCLWLCCFVLLCI